MTIIETITGKRRRRNIGVKTVFIEDPAQLPEWMYWGSKRLRLRLLIPAELLRMIGAFACRGGAHPFIEALRCGPQALSAFYAAHQPGSAAEAHWLGDASRGVGPAELPWIGRDVANPYAGEKGLGTAHGYSMYGPCSAEKVALELRRLRRLVEAIRREGFNPDRYGDIQGTFLRHGSDFRFFVRGGKHRAAVLGYLGFRYIPVAFTSEWPRVVCRHDSAAWPLVRQRRLSEETARAIFDSYFRLDGTEQYRMLGLHPSGEVRGDREG